MLKFSWDKNKDDISCDHFFLELIRDIFPIIDTYTLVLSVKVTSEGRF